MNQTKKPREDKTIWRDSPVCIPWTPVPLRLMRHWHRVGWQEADPDTGGTTFVPVGDPCFTTLCWVLRWARHDLPDPLVNIDMSIRGAARERGIESSTISKHLARLEKAGIIKLTSRGRWNSPLIDATPLIARLQEFEEQAAKEKAAAGIDLSSRLVGHGLQLCACGRPNCRRCGRPRKLPPEEQPQFGEPDHEYLTPDEPNATTASESEYLDSISSHVLEDDKPKPALQQPSPAEKQ